MKDLGLVLRALRENTCLSQRDFAERIGLDQSRISRIEGGTVIPAEDELTSWLENSRPEDASCARTWIAAPWEAMSEPAPAWNSPSVAALAAAAEATERLYEDFPENLRPSVERYRAELVAAFRALRNLSYRVALVGATAVGKSTAESNGLELRTPSGDLILPSGGGSTTLCEVLIEQGDRWGIVIEPESPEEVRRLVEDLCGVLQPKGERSPEDRPAIPGEVRLALLNMAGIGPKTETGAAGQTLRREPIRELAQAEGDRLVSSILIRLRLAERHLTEMWWEAGMAGEPLSWLRDNLRKINKGLHPEVPLPQRLRLILARPVIYEGPFTVSVVDTRGITDNVVRRPDLAGSLADGRTVTILCSSFLSAPDLYVRSLIRYADEQEFVAWRTRVVLLLLARPSEPPQIRYEDTDELVETAEDGIRIKEAHTRQQLAELDRGDVTVATYNALHDPPSLFRSLLLDRIVAMRSEEERRISVIAAAAADMLDNARNHLVQVARQAVARDVLLVLDALKSIERGAGQPQDLLLREVAQAHPRSIWAMARRQGQWRALSLELHISDGAADVARVWSRDPLMRLTAVLDLLEKRLDLKPAHGLVQQLREATEAAKAAFVTQGRTTARAAIWSAMHADLRLWADCEAEWRPGFRIRVIARLGQWFDQNRPYVEDFYGRLENAWQDTLINPLRRLCSSPDAP